LGFYVWLIAIAPLHLGALTSLCWLVVGWITSLVWFSRLDSAIGFPVFAVSPIPLVILVEVWVGGMTSLLSVDLVLYRVWDVEEWELRPRLSFPVN
jgi:hypothetical protein